MILCEILDLDVRKWLYLLDLSLYFYIALSILSILKKYDFIIEFYY